MATQREITFLRQFAVLWGLLTAVYLGTTLYRALAYHISPAYPTYAGRSAVLAVWLDIFAVVRSRTILRLAVMLTLLSSVLLSGAVVVTAALHGRRLLIGRTAFTILFAILLYQKTRDMIAQRRLT